jgi:WD40 repeat protein
MPISLACDVCGKKYKLSDDLAGKTYSCKECGFTMDVPGGRKSSHGEEVIDRKPPKSSATIRATGGKSSGSIRKRGKKSADNTMQMLAVGGGVLIAVIVLGAIFGGGGNQGPSLAPPPPTPAAPQPVASNSVVPVTTPSTTTHPPTTTSNPAVTSPPTTAVPPTTEITKPALVEPPEAPTVPATPKTLVTLAAAPGWAATADPSLDPLPTDWATDWKLPVTGLSMNENSVGYPATPSSFVVLGSDDTGKVEREIWNLATGKKVAAFSGASARITSIMQPMALSPDGKYLAWNQGRKITVYDVSAKKVLGELEGGFGSTRLSIDRVDLPTPNRVVALSRGGRALQVWSLPDGEMVHLTPLGDRYQHPELSAFSPGGKYVAMEADASDHTIQIHDVETGNVVGRIVPEKGRSPTANLLPMAFSPDGQRLAVAFESNSSPSATQLTIWNMADGTPIAEHSMTPSIGSRLTSTYKTSGLQWFADSRKLLVHGLTILDADSGESLYQLDTPQMAFAAARRPIGSNIVADLSGKPRELVFQAISVTDDDLQRAAQVAAVDGLAIDLKLPPLTKTEPLSPTPSDPATPWRVMPASPEPSPSMLAEPLVLKSSKGTLRGISVAPLQTPPVLFAKFSEGEDLDAIMRQPQDVRTRVDSEGRIHSNSREPIFDAPVNWIEAYDLATKQSLRKIDLPFSADLLGCSPDGTRLLVHPHRSQGRLDVLDAADGAPIVAFRPYRSLAEERDWDVTKAVLLDAEHIATLNEFDLFAIWKLPACRPICAVNQVWKFAISPRGDSIALATDTGVDIRSAATGESLGFVPMTGMLCNLAFHPQGDRLAVFVRGQGGSQATIVDLSTGQTSGTAAIPYASEQRDLLWAGDQYVLQHRNMGSFGIEKPLIDVRSGATLWRYTLGPDGLLINPPPGDARLWYAVPKSKSAGMSVVAASLPEDAVVKAIGSAQSSTELLMKPGDKVAARFDIPAPSSRPQLENEVISAVHKAIERSGVVLAPTSPIELHVSTETKTGGSSSVRRPGAADVSVKETTATLQLAYKRGADTLWQQRLEFSNLGQSTVVLKADEAPQAAYDRDLWERVTGYLKTLELPANLFSLKSRNGLGASVLAPNGPAIGK